MNNQQQSIDSMAPGFSMPDNWHWREVDAWNGEDVHYCVRLVGWIVSDTVLRPYCVTDGSGWVVWTEHIRFADSDACDWSDDGHQSNGNNSHV